MILFCLSSLSAFSQEKLIYGLYYAKNPKHEITTYKKILLVSNVSNKAKKYLRRYAAKAKYNVILYDDLFPPYKKWTPDEVDSVIIAEDFDAFLTVNIEGVETYQTSFGGGTFIQLAEFASPIMMSQTTTKTKVGSTELEIFLIDKNTAKDEYVIFISGWVTGRPEPAVIKSTYHLFKKFKKLGVSYPPCDGTGRFFKYSTINTQYTMLNNEAASTSSPIPPPPFPNQNNPLFLPAHILLSIMRTECRLYHHHFHHHFSPGERHSH